MPLPSTAVRLIARAVRATSLIDRAYRRFSRLRSRIVVTYASDEFYDEYNRIAYASQKVYRYGAENFRTGLFAWEARAVQRHFPPPPARVLVGAAGGGREALALVGMGYRVVAFEPARSLAASMLEGTPARDAVEVYVGRYEDLPFVSALDDARVKINLQQREPFHAVVLGWASLSHLRSDQLCVAALRHAGDLTHGPILVSYFLQMPSMPDSPPRSEGFAIDVGYFKEFSEHDVRRIADTAGLTIVEHNHESGWPHAVLRRIR